MLGHLSDPRTTRRYHVRPTDSFLVELPTNVSIRVANSARRSRAKVDDWFYYLSQRRGLPRYVREGRVVSVQVRECVSEIWSAVCFWVPRLFRVGACALGVRQKVLSFVAIILPRRCVRDKSHSTYATCLDKVKYKLFDKREQTRSLLCSTSLCVSLEVTFRVDLLLHSTPYVLPAVIFG